MVYIQVTHKDALSQITEMTGAAITTRGQYFRPGTAVPAGERKLFLLIEGPTELSVKRAKAEVKRVLEETTEKVRGYECVDHKDAEKTFIMTLISIRCCVISISFALLSLSLWL